MRARRAQFSPCLFFPAFRLLFGVVLCVPWLQRELAQRYLTLGLGHEASEIYERLELWDGVIDSYRAVGKLEQAERLVRQRLDEEPTAALW